MRIARNIAVRAAVVAQTRGIHQTLHDDPLLSRLTAPDVARDEYLSALRVFSGFYNAVECERLRLGVWPELSLARECTALENDLGNCTFTETRLNFPGRLELLGGLYVAHGASFGRKLFRKNLMTALPDAPQAFLCQRMDKATWRRLTTLMETSGQNVLRFQRVNRGAERSFDAVLQASRSLQTESSERRIMSV